MYQQGYGIIETLAPLHVGATAGEETGNLNLIFRDQFTQTGIIPGSSIRGRLRSEMRQKIWQDDSKTKVLDPNVAESKNKYLELEEVEKWYGKGAEKNRGEEDYESAIKIEYASIVWLPVFCPGQPIVWVTCPRLLARYKRVTGITTEIPDPETASHALFGQNEGTNKTLFFNFGFLEVKKAENETGFTEWFPDDIEKPAVILKDADIGLVHDMALYRQSRVALELDTKIVNGDGGFFNVEALPEGTVMAFPIGMKKTKSWEEWNPIAGSKAGDIYLGGLESVGFGHCSVEIKQHTEEQ